MPMSLSEKILDEFIEKARKLDLAHTDKSVRSLLHGSPLTKNEEKD